MVFVDGALMQRKYTDKNGVVKTVMNINLGSDGNSIDLHRSVLSYLC